MHHSRRALFLIALTISALLFGGLTPTAAQDPKAPPPDDPALTSAVQSAVNQYRATNSLYAPRPNGMMITPMKYAGPWVWIIVGIGPLPGADNAPDSHLVLAKYEAGVWQVAVEYTPTFRNWLPQVPDTVVAAREKANFTSTPEAAGNGSAQLSLPWTTGETWYLTGGPHGSTIGGNRPWAAIDLSNGSQGGGTVRAAREGTAYVPCGNAGNFIRVDHPDGYQTGYFHIAQASITVSNGQGITRGHVLGATSAEVGVGTPCEGSALGPHVHFSLRLNGSGIDINGHDVGGWTVQDGAAAYEGCMKRVSDNHTVCVGGQIYNDGSIGSGTPLANDTFANPTIIGSLPFSADQAVATATAEGSDPDMSCIGDGNPRHFTRSVWFRYAPSASGRIRAEIIEGTDQYDSVMAAYTGTMGSFAQAACNDDVGGSGYTYRSAFDMDVVAGTTYHLMVAQWTDGSYNPVSPYLRLRVTSLSTPPAITTQPQSQTINYDTTATLSVVASGTAPLTYQWYRGASGDTTNPVGTNAATFTTPKLKTTTQYWVKVSNGAANASSQTATITVKQPDTVGIFRPSSGAFYLRNSNTTGPANITVTFGAPSDLPLVGDWNGDGIDTVGVYRPATAQFFLKDANTTGAAVAYTFAFGVKNELPLAGDWDGDGKDSIGVFNNGRLFLRNALSDGFPDFFMEWKATQGLQPLAGDWNGDGKDSPGMFNAATAQFGLSNQICNCRVTTADHVFQLGNANDVGFAGDWNGDGVDGVGVFRPTNGITYLKNALATGFADISIIYGVAGDKPVAGKWAAPASAPERAPIFAPGH